MSPISLSFLFIFTFSTTGLSKTSDDIINALNKLRDIKPIESKEEVDVLNTNMDAAWKIVLNNPKESQSIVESELKKEIEKKESSDQFFLLDVGYLFFILQNQEKKKHEEYTISDTVINAIAKIHPKELVIQLNDKELFQFVHNLAKTGNTKISSEIDRIYLTNDRDLSLFDAPHVISLNPEDQYVMLKGSNSPNIANDLIEHLNSQIEVEAKVRIAAILNSLATEETSEKIYQTILAEDNNDIRTRLISALMRLGGPKGKSYVIKLHQEKKMDDATKKYLEEIIPNVKKYDYASMTSDIKKIGLPPKKLSDVEVKQQLQKMYENYGKDDETFPISIVESGLPKSYLLDMLKKIRQRSFFRGNNHVFEDLPVTNAVINCIQFKDK